MNLVNHQKALGELLDIPAETRGEDFEAKLVAAKVAVTASHTEVELASLVEPTIPEHRQETPEGREFSGS